MRSPKSTIIQAAPVAEAAPPVQKQAAEVVQATMDLRQQELMKKNMRSTTKAGETGGFRANPMKGAPNAGMLAAGAGSAMGGG